jgi:hypothetical protein
MLDSVPEAGSTGGAPTRDELAKIIQHNLDLDGHHLSQDTNEVCPPCARLADAILDRWPAPAGGIALGCGPSQVIFSGEERPTT